MLSHTRAPSGVWFWSCTRACVHGRAALVLHTRVRPWACSSVCFPTDGVTPHRLCRFSPSGHSASGPRRPAPGRTAAHRSGAVSRSPAWSCPSVGRSEAGGRHGRAGVTGALSHCRQEDLRNHVGAELAGLCFNGDGFARRRPLCPAGRRGLWRPEPCLLSALPGRAGPGLPLTHASRNPVLRPPSSAAPAVLLLAVQPGPQTSPPSRVSERPPNWGQTRTSPWPGMCAEQEVSDGALPTLPSLAPRRCSDGRRGRNRDSAHEDPGCPVTPTPLHDTPGCPVWRHQALFVPR